MSDLKTYFITSKIFKQAKNGLVKIGDEKYPWSFYSKFFSKIEGIDTTSNSSYPTFNIPDYPKFLELVGEYLKTAKHFYSRDEVYFDLENNTDFEEKLFFDLLVNATPADMQNIFSYIKNRTEMIKVELPTGKQQIGTYNGFDVTQIVSKRFSNLESPYRFIPEFYDPVSRTTFTLPTVTFGIVNGVAQVGAIQNENKSQPNQASKKLDRHFRKVNKDVDTEDIIYNISPNALVSFTMFVSYLKSLGVTKITTTPFQPIRYNTQKHGKYAHAKTPEEIAQISEEMDRNQFNATNKVLYTFLRFAHHFEGSEAYFEDDTETMHLSTANITEPTSDNIIFDIANIGNHTPEILQKEKVR